MKTSLTHGALGIIGVVCGLLKECVLLRTIHGRRLRSVELTSRHQPTESTMHGLAFSMLTMSQILVRAWQP